MWLVQRMLLGIISRSASLKDNRKSPVHEFGEWAHDRHYQLQCYRPINVEETVLLHTTFATPLATAAIAAALTAAALTAAALSTSWRVDAGHQRRRGTHHLSIQRHAVEHQSSNALW